MALDDMQSCEMCCFGFQTNCTTTTVTPNIKTRPLDDCGDKCVYLTDGESDYPKMMPVKFGPAPGTVIPCPDGVGAFGIILCPAMGPQQPVMIQRTGHVCWTDIACALGADPKDAAAWWAIHVALAEANIYVEFA